MRGGLNHAHGPLRCGCCAVWGKGAGSDLVRAPLRLRLAFAASSVAATVKADWVLRGFVRTTLELNGLSTFLRVRTFKSAPLRNTQARRPWLWAEHGSHACVAGRKGGVSTATRGGWPRVATFSQSNLGTLYLPHLVIPRHPAANTYYLPSGCADYVASGLIAVSPGANCQVPIADRRRPCTKRATCFLLL
jgi:hypothetical protein